MSALRIYADFNGLVRGCLNPERTAVVLDTFGSLRDLSNAGVVLQAGLPLIAVDASDDDEDLEGHGTAQYDPANRWWVVEFDEQGVRYVPAGDRTAVRAFLCVQCRVDLQSPLQTKGLNVSSACPSCGTPLLTPFNPPPPA
jgi:hypothetical protein